MDDFEGYVPEWILKTIPEDVSDTLFKIVVHVKGSSDQADGEVKRKSITLDILPLVGIQYDTVEQDLEKTPGQLVFVSALYSELRNHVSTIERAIKTRRAKLTKTILDSQKQEGVRLTNDQVTQIVNSDDKLIELEEAMAKKQMQSGKLYYYIEAIKMKNDNLRSLMGMKKSGI